MYTLNYLTLGSLNSDIVHLDRQILFVVPQEIQKGI